MLQLEAHWIASYLWCPVSEVPLYESTAVEMLTQDPSGSFAVRMTGICELTNTSIATLLSE